MTYQLMQLPLTQDHHEVEDLQEQVIKTLIAGKKEAVYFSVLFFSLLLAFYYFIRHKRTGILATLIHLLILITAFYGTWYFILRFVEQDLKSYMMHGGDLIGWLRNSNIFFKAYQNVVNSKNGIWWTSQLLSWSITFGVFLSVESRRISLSIIGRMAYMFLGLLAAIAVPTALFTTFVPISYDKDAKKYDTNAPMLSFVFVITSIIGFACIYLLPKTVTAFPFAFRVILILCHVAVALPIFIPLSINIKGDSTRYSLCAFYGFLAGASFVLHFIYTTEVMLPLFDDKFNIQLLGKKLLLTFSKTNDCLTSVSLDIIFCALITVLLIFHFNPLLGIISLILTPILSPSVLFPFFLLCREFSMIPKSSPTQLQDKRKEKKVEDPKKNIPTDKKTKTDPKTKVDINDGEPKKKNEKVHRKKKR